MKLLKKKVPALFLILLVVLSLTVPALAASSTDTAAAPAAAETTQTQSDATGSKSIAAGIAIGLAAAGGAVNRLPANRTAMSRTHRIINFFLLFMLIASLLSTPEYRRCGLP